MKQMSQALIHQIQEEYYTLIQFWLNHDIENLLHEGLIDLCYSTHYRYFSNREFHEDFSLQMSDHFLGTLKLAALMTFKQPETGHRSFPNEMSIHTPQYFQAQKGGFFNMRFNGFPQLYHPELRAVLFTKDGINLIDLCYHKASQQSWVNRHLVHILKQIDPTNEYKHNMAKKHAIQLQVYKEINKIAHDLDHLSMNIGICHVFKEFRSVLFTTIPAFLAKFIPEKEKYMLQTAAWFNCLISMTLSSQAAYSKDGLLFFTEKELKQQFHDLPGIFTFFSEKYIGRRVHRNLPLSPRVLDIKELENIADEIEKKIGYQILSRIYTTPMQIYNCYIQFLHEILADPEYRQQAGYIFEDFIREKLVRWGFDVRKLIFFSRLQMTNSNYQAMVIKLAQFYRGKIHYIFAPTLDHSPGDGNYIEYDLLARIGSRVYFIECKSRHIPHWRNLKIDAWQQEDDTIIAKNAKNVENFLKYHHYCINDSELAAFCTDISEHIPITVKSEGFIHAAKKGIIFDAQLEEFFQTNEPSIRPKIKTLNQQLDEEIRIQF
jgi:hypothetical protein